MRNVRAAAVQFEHAAGDKDRNLAKIREFVARAALAGAEIVAFPDCCITGYWFLRHLTREQLLALAEPAVDGPSSQVLRDLARRHKMTVGAGLVEGTEDGRLFNTYLVALPDGRMQRHRELHCFVSEHMQSGEEYTVFDTPYGCRAAVLLCHDNAIVENVRNVALRGATVLLAPHQTGGYRSRNPHVQGLIERRLWDNRASAPQAIEAELRGPKGREWLLRWLPARAHDSGLFVIFSNGIGVDDDEIRTGNAMILDPYGRILAETCTAGDDLVVADLDASLLEQCTGRQWLRARRPELYGPLAIHTGMEQSSRRLRFDDEHV
jgi:predicted amidohydrolase